MKIALKVRQRIAHDAGEIVEVSPDVAAFLLSIDAAEIVKADTPKKGTKKNGKGNKTTDSDG